MKGTDEITNSEDIIDSRDVIARIEYLESERESAKLEGANVAAYEEENNEEVLTVENGDTFKPDEWDDERESEYQALRALAEEADGCSDWQYGEALIRDSYFEDYARQLAEDIGAIPDDARWPCTCIDWEQAARELRMDYTSVGFGGVDYWIRS